MTVGLSTSSFPGPKPRSISSIKNKLTYTSLTSSFECWFNVPLPVLAFMQNNHPGRLGLLFDYLSESDYLSLSCNETNLPGSSFATHDANNDYTGISQKHAYRRLYDDRIDFTFYVRNDYLEIMFFENWMASIANEQFASETIGTVARPTINEPTYNYRFNYPDTYKGQIHIHKFERDYGRTGSNFLNLTSPSSKYLRYKLLDAYPISMNSMPVSYEASNVLKLTVSFTFSRYVVERLNYPILAQAVGGIDIGGGIHKVDLLIDGDIKTIYVPKTVYDKHYATSSTVP